MKDDAAQKKAPGKDGSQGGKGRHPFPGAIGRFEPATRARGCEMSRLGQTSARLRMWVR